MAVRSASAAPALAAVAASISPHVIRSIVVRMIIFMDPPRPRDDRTSYARSMAFTGVAASSRRWPCVLCAGIPMALSTGATAAPLTANQELLLDQRVLMRQGKVTVWAGGFGSAMAPHPSLADHFYFLSDRGPNAGTGREDEKVFLQPSYAPRIALFRRQGARLRRVREILLRDEAGRPLTGMPNPPGAGGTGERALDSGSRELPADRRGVDPEGLVALPDGTFWVAEEYGD